MTEYKHFQNETLRKLNSKDYSDLYNTDITFDCNINEMVMGENWTPLRLICEGGDIKALNTLLESSGERLGTDVFAMGSAAAEGHSEIIKRLFEIEYYRESTPARAIAILNAAKTGRSSIIELIVDLSAPEDKPYILQAAGHGISTFETAANNKHYEAMYTLALHTWPNGPADMPEPLRKYLPDVMIGKRMRETNCACFDYTAAMAPRSLDTISSYNGVMLNAYTSHLSGSLSDKDGETTQNTSPVNNLGGQNKSEADKIKFNL